MQIQDNIAQTLFITLYMRCLETKQKVPIIDDKKACDLVNKIDYDFSKFDKAVRSLVGVSLRVRHFDKQVKEFIKSKKNPIVVLLGCGLDTRVDRIGELADDAIFYELDLPEVISYREQLIVKPINSSYIPSSMFETDWMDEIKQEHPDGDFIFIIEGILMYFYINEIESLFINLSKRFINSDIHFDIVNKWMSKNSHMHDSVKYTNASFKFGLDDDKKIENWAENLMHQKTWLYGDFPEWKRAGLINGLLMKIVPIFKYGGRILHYKVIPKIKTTSIQPH